MVQNIAFSALVIILTGFIILWSGRIARSDSRLMKLAFWIVVLLLLLFGGGSDQVVLVAVALVSLVGYVVNTETFRNALGRVTRIRVSGFMGGVGSFMLSQGLLHFGIPASSAAGLVGAAIIYFAAKALAD